MPGDKGLIQDVRPASAEVTGQQRELFAFDAFEYEDPNKNNPAKITVKEGWKLNLQRAVIGDTDLSVDGSFLNVDLIEAGAINASKIDVTDLFAQDITATGTITGATIIGGNITGGEIRIGGTFIEPNFFVNTSGDMSARGEISNVNVAGDVGISIVGGELQFHGPTIFGGSGRGLISAPTPAGPLVIRNSSLFGGVQLRFGDAWVNWGAGGFIFSDDGIYNIGNDTNRVKEIHALQVFGAVFN